MSLKLSFRNYVVLKVVIWLWLLISITFAYDMLNNYNIVIGIVFSIVLIQMTIIVFVDSWYKFGKPRLLDWFRLSTFIGLIVSFLSMFSEFDKPSRFINGFYIDSELIVPSFFVIFLGLLGLRLGEFFFYKVKHKKKKPSQKVYVFRSIYIFYLLAIVITIIQIFLMYIGVLGYGTRQEFTTASFSFLLPVVNGASLLVLSMFAIFKYYYNYKQRIFDRFFLGYFLLQVYYGFLSGMKETIIIPFIILLIPYIYSGKIIVKKYLLIGLLSALFLYPLTNNYRDNINSNTHMSKSEALSEAISETLELSVSENLEDGSDSFSSRLTFFEELMYAVNNEYKWGFYENFNRYIYLPVAWVVPRYFLPGKPKSYMGAELNNMMFGNRLSSHTVSTYGWAYFEGGFIQVFISFFLFGIVISYFEFVLNKKNLFGMIIYIYIMVLLLKIEKDIYFLINAIFQATFVYFIFYKALIKEKSIGNG